MSVAMASAAALLGPSLLDEPAPVVVELTGVAPPSSARGPEVTTLDEALTRLPEANLPAPTLYPTTTTTTRPTSAPPRTEAERRGQAALDRISYDWPTELAGWEFVFSPGRSGVLGYTYVTEKRIEIFVRTSQSADLLAHVVAHEMGHAVDVTKNSGDDRRRWQDARRIEDAVWWPGDGATDFSTGAGDFAESFAAWQIGPANFRSNLAGAPNADQLAVLAGLAFG